MENGESVVRIVAALFVEPRGTYAGLPGIELWDENRDARLYDGPHPVVAHPPCERWGRYWGGGPMLARTPRAKKKGADGGCFASALASVRKWGGVLEHPADSHAWRAFGLAPPLAEGWHAADFYGGWCCRVEQGHYGHRARKATWLYACKVELSSLAWGKSSATAKLDDGFCSDEERRRSVRTGIVQRLSKAQRAATPTEFRDVLLAMARSVT